MRIKLEGRTADAFGTMLADWWRKFYRLEDKGRPGWVSFADLKRAVLACEFESGPGDSPENAVVINGAPTPVISEFAEALYLCDRFGLPDKDWWLENRTIDPDLHPGLEQVLVMLPDFNTKTIFFDISQAEPQVEEWSDEMDAEPHAARFFTLVPAPEVTSGARLATDPARSRILPPEYSYPLHLHDRMPPPRRARSLDRLVVSVYEEPADITVLPAGEPFSSRLTLLQKETL